jgi:hypothetical protein
MTPETKTSVSRKSILLGIGIACVGAVAASWFRSRKDKVVVIDGIAHLMFRPLTPAGEELLDNITNTVNNRASVTATLSPVDDI